jgi:putative transcriptional regulator
MKINYDNLWKKMEECNISRTELRILDEISSSSYTKLINNENVIIDVLLRVCEVLNSDVSEILRCRK